MPVSIAASSHALYDSMPIDMSDPSILPDVTIHAPIGMNLTLLGAAEMDIPGQDVPETFLQRVNLPLLASSVSAAYAGGVDSITLDRDFHVHPTAPPRSAALDGVTMAGKLGLGKTPQICAEIPSDPLYIREAVSLLTNARVASAAVTLTLQEIDDYHDFKRAADDARAAGVSVWLLATNPRVTGENAETVASIFDAVRVRHPDRAAVRQMRFALKEAARKRKSDLTVFADLGIVISATLQAAEERSILISQLNGGELFSGMASVVGTVYDVADAIESWVGMGAADGMVLTPASLPTDLASVLKGVLPLLEARATIERE